MSVRENTISGHRVLTLPLARLCTAEASYLPLADQPLPNFVNFLRLISTEIFRLVPRVVRGTWQYPRVVRMTIPIVQMTRVPSGIPIEDQSRPAILLKIPLVSIPLSMTCKYWA